MLVLVGEESVAGPFFTSNDGCWGPGGVINRACRVCFSAA